MPRPPLNSPGDVVGEWTLLRYLPGRGRGKGSIVAMWECRCSCGTERDVRADHLRNGTSKSCGHDLAAQRSERMRARHAERRYAAGPTAP